MLAVHRQHDYVMTKSLRAAESNGSCWAGVCVAPAVNAWTEGSLPCFVHPTATPLCLTRVRATCTREVVSVHS